MTLKNNEKEISLRIINVAVCLALLSSLTPVAAFAQLDAGQDQYGARERDDQDRWSDAESEQYCKAHKHEKGCFKTEEQIKNQRDADVAVPAVPISFFIGGVWIMKKIKAKERS